MARFQPTGLVQAITGSIGNLTFRTHRGTGIIQIKPRPRGQRSELQRTRIKSFGRIATRWRQTLTATQRAQWNAYAKEHTLRFQTRRTTPMPGYNAFIQHNILSLWVGQGFLDTPPAVALILAPHNHAITWNFNNRFSVNWANWPIPAGTIILLSLSHGFPQSRSAPRITFRQHWAQAGPKAVAGTYFINTPFQSGLQARVYTRQVRTDGRFSNYVVNEATWP